MYNQLKKGMRLHLLKNLVSKNFIKKDFLDKEDLMIAIDNFEKETDQEIDINLRKELFNLKRTIIGKDFFEIKAIESINNGNFDLIDIFEKEINSGNGDKIKNKLMEFNDKILFPHSLKSNNFKIASERVEDLIRKI